MKAVGSLVSARHPIEAWRELGRRPQGITRVIALPRTAAPAERRAAAGLHHSACRIQPRAELC